MPRTRPQLPIEIIQSELLPRLPAKSIGRFRCVSKSWNSFLSTPDFARIHLRYQTNYKLLMLKHASPTFRTLDCEPMSQDSITTHRIPFKGYVTILASLDGLVCVALNETRELAFWNPLTGAYKKFHTSFYDNVHDGTLALYRDSSNDYKVLHVVSKGAFVYSRRLDSWRKINNPCIEVSHYMSNFDWSVATFFEGKVYFKLTSTKIFGNCVNGHISFDVECERFKDVQYPCKESLSASLVVINGCIHLGLVNKVNSSKCDLWKMDGDGNGWIKVKAFSCVEYCDGLIMRDIHVRKTGNLLAIWEDNDGFKSVEVEDLLTDCYYVYRGNWSHEHRRAIYVETLVSPGP